MTLYECLSQARPYAVSSFMSWSDPKSTLLPTDSFETALRKCVHIGHPLTRSAT